jgi:DNA-directed RNA polymerase subunit RPC12/RpoP
MDIFDRIDLQIKRRAAYQDGLYDLDDWEGFECINCGNRQLSAEADLEDSTENLNTICENCGSRTETSEEETDWDKVREKIPTEYISGEALETDNIECPSCKRDIKDEDNTVIWSLGNRKETLHQRCAEAIWENSIENPVWFDTFTPQHYEKVAEFLLSFDSIGEVITNNGNLYSMGEMYIHTNYCTTSIVKDVIDAFNGRIVYAGVAREDSDRGFSCVQEHGTCFEILIDFCTSESTNLPPEYLDKYDKDEESLKSEDYFVMKSDEPLFDADFDVIKRNNTVTVPDKYRDN